MCFICVSHQTHQGEHPNHIDTETTPVQHNLMRLQTADYYVKASAQSTNVDQYINTITDDRSWSGSIGQSATVTYSFDTSAIDTSVVYADLYWAFSGAQQQAALDAMSKMSNITNITFVETTSASADIHFYNGDIGGLTSGIAGYYYSLTGSTNTMTYAAIGMDDDYQDFSTIGSRAYETLLHELGHAVGLKHPGYYGSGDEGPFLPSELDNTALTVMSYTESGDSATDYRPLDVAALHYLYGVKGQSTDTGGTTTTSGGSDGDGISSTTNLDAVQNDSLSATTASDMKGGLGSDTLNGSGGNDTIYGGRAIADADDAQDYIYGNAGDDEIYGNTGGDVIYGDDTGNSVSGADTIFGGLGEDTIYGGAGDDSLAGGGGIKHPQDQTDVIYGGDGNDSIVANGGNDTVYGEAGNDTFWGGLGDDILLGGAGDDVIAGQIGNDGLSGGSGSDTFYYLGNDGLDVISDFDTGSDRFLIHNNINNSGILTGNDALSRLTSSDGYTILDLGEGSYVYFTANISSLTANHFEILY